MRVVIEGRAGEGKTTLAWAIFHMLNRAGFKVTLQDDVETTMSLEDIAKRGFPRDTRIAIETRQIRHLPDENTEIRHLPGEELEWGR